MEVKRVEDKRDIYEAMSFAAQQKNYDPVRVGIVPALQMCSTQEVYGIENEEYVHLVVKGSDTYECIFYGTEDDAFYNFEFVVYELDEEVHMLLNVVSIDNRPLTDELIANFETKLKNKDVEFWKSAKEEILKEPEDVIQEKDELFEVFLENINNLAMREQEEQLKMKNR